MGVQMATDIKDVFPEKSVTLVHSRARVMNKFHQGLHDVVSARCAELDVALVLGRRVKVPGEGFPADGAGFDVCLQDGTRIPADFAVC